jgi:hypothetical protein
MMQRSNVLELVAKRRTKYAIAAVAAAGVVFSPSPASAQYGTDPPLPPLPPLQGEAAPPTAAPPPAATAGSPASSTPVPPPTAPPPAAPSSGVAGAVGSADVVPATGTAGEVRDTGVGGPTVRVVSSERAEPVALGGDDLPFTGANIALFVMLGAGLLVLGLAVRRRSGVRAAKP